MSGDSVLSLHAGCVVLGETGILIRGESGAGKSTFARRIVSDHAAGGGFARIVSDDRVVLTRRHGRLIARPNPTLAGLTEIRGLGILPVDHEPAVVLHLVVDLVAAPGERMPSPETRETALLGLPLPRIAAPVTDAADLLKATLSWQARHGDDRSLRI